MLNLMILTTANKNANHLKQTLVVVLMIQIPRRI